MALEIERKYLVTNDSYRKMATEIHTIRQAYISANPDATARLRIYDSSAFLTIKSRNNGAIRNEWEYEIPLSDAYAMFENCNLSSTIEKRRYIVPANDGLKWEIDEFEGKNSGLIIAEIELPYADYAVEQPDFIGKEVTGNPAYYNSTLANK